ncbi:hypothetical protein QTP88_010053 [Uroleucon formosanum]
MKIILLVIVKSIIKYKMYGILPKFGLHYGQKNSINFQKSNIDSKVRISSEWVGFEIVAAGYNRTNQLASLRNKIKQHSESKAHVLAENIL